ncbi:MAG: hypothetical protein H8D34_10690 [Chloroflexi bacterium]|nr:hypothetical protein [Chloroflexota bacterium]
MGLWKRIPIRWLQFLGESSSLVAGFQLLIVNLAYIDQLRAPEKKRLVVIVDSWREAVILWLLWICKVLPRYNIWVIRRTGHLDLYAEGDFGGEQLLVATSRAFTKHYQLLAKLRQQRRLMIL